MKASNYENKDMSGKIAKSFLTNPLTAFLGIFLLFMGYISMNVISREEDPQIAISGGSVIVSVPGATANEIERIILKPLERKLREVSGIEHIYAQAMDNVAIVNVTYYIGENREDSNLKLYDKVMQNMDEMPRKVQMPLIKPFDIDIDIPIVTVAFYLKNKGENDEVRLSSFVKDIQNEINGIENVSKTSLKGDHKKQYNIYVNSNKLLAYNLSIHQIIKSVEAVSYNSPDISGRVSDGSIAIFGIKNAIENVSDVQNIIVSQHLNSPIYLKDVAEIVAGFDEQKLNDAKLYFRDAKGAKMSEEKMQVTLLISKLPGKNSVTVSQEVLDVLENKKEFFKENGIGYIITRDYGKRANEAVSELMHHLVITIGIIAIMLIFVLGWRESLIVTLTVPAILAITIFVAYMTGQTMNRITLFALLLSLGLLVDSAIIVIENIHRHLHSPDSLPMKELVVQATDEIGPPTNVASIAIILTMIPMGFVGGMMGSFMKPIPYNVPVAIIASVFVAYIFTPYLSYKLLKKPDHLEHSDKQTKNKSKGDS